MTHYPRPAPTSTSHAARRGLDAARDAEIRAAALELLAERGYDRLTVEAIAERARAGKATIYRRWPSKAALVVDALNQLRPPPEEPPDTGSLAGDVGALVEASLPLGPPPFQVVCGMAPALHQDPELAAAFRDAFVEPRRALLRQVLERAVTRGEVPPRRDLDLVTSVLPAMMLHRVVFAGEAPDQKYARAVVDRVLLPLATAPPSPAEQPEAEGAA